MSGCRRALGDPRSSEEWSRERRDKSVSQGTATVPGDAAAGGKTVPWSLGVGGVGGPAHTSISWGGTGCGVSTGQAFKSLGWERERSQEAVTPGDGHLPSLASPPGPRASSGHRETRSGHQPRGVGSVRPGIKRRPPPASAPRRASSPVCLGPRTRTPRVAPPPRDPGPEHSARHGGHSESVGLPSPGPARASAALRFAGRYYSCGMQPIR